LILTKAPLRVSFIGGGTDYESFLASHGGLVVAAGISKSVFVNILELPPFAREKFRFTYRITESVEKASDFLHPSLRETLTALDWDIPLNIATMADVPGSSGLGSSSAFVVALKLALDTLKKRECNPTELAEFAIDIERRRLSEPGGIQDQYEAAFGGFKAYRFSETGCEVYDFLLSGTQLCDLSNYFSLISVVGERFSSTHAVNTSRAKTEILLEMLRATEKVVSDLKRATSIEEIALVLHAAISTDWEIKQHFSSGIVDKSVSDCIRILEDLGISSFKLCGAGGSGFLLVGHEPGVRDRLSVKFPNGFVMSPDFIQDGAKVLLR
jgi:D-glycero-alpha-D-manno-heptose-7-phosphate kinase